MLHIHNGDSTADTMREAGFPGEHFAFRESLATGPTPQGLTQGAWFSVRANALGGEHELVASIKENLLRQDEVLTNPAGHEEIILWFEHDLFCQINLVYLLNHFAQQGTGTARLSLICIGAFPGRPNFHGLGELTAEEMASLFETRHEVTAAELRLAQKVWDVYCSPDPQRLASLLGEDTSALPYLGAALQQHLTRYPSLHNGLGHAENLLLRFIAEGNTKFRTLCPAFFNAEPAYGLGDSQIWEDLERMGNAAQPLLQFVGAEAITGDVRRLQVECRITPTGQRVLAGEADFVALNGIDLWLGGVHLHQDNLWRWDAQQGLVQASI